MEVLNHWPFTNCTNHQLQVTNHYLIVNYQLCIVFKASP
jgi:hypothetical protein